MALEPRVEYNSQEQQDIENLIAEENDPKVRLQLIVMNRINKSLIENTRTTLDIVKQANEFGEQLSAHIKNFELHRQYQDEIQNKGKGAWIVFAKVIGAVQIVGLGIWGYASNEISDIHGGLHSLEKVDSGFDTRITVLELKDKK
ncbi:MAG: hypothetical protein PHT07_20750 [Paludibacter sp.]|nr:hypothetical protein [Paludibacter sp.]